jgi:hypothetical protein
MARARIYCGLVFLEKGRQAEYAGSNSNSSIRYKPSVVSPEEANQLERELKGIKRRNDPDAPMQRDVSSALHTLNEDWFFKYRRQNAHGGAKGGA